MNKENILQTVKEYETAQKKMIENGLLISGASSPTVFHVDDCQLNEIADILNQQIEIEPITHEGKDVVTAYLYFDKYTFHAWDYKGRI